MNAGIRTAFDNIVDISNYAHGAILGGGNSNILDPVILLDTQASEGGTGSVHFYNAGLTSSYQLPTFTITGDPFSPPNVPTITLDYAKIFSDAHDISQFAGTGGAGGSIANLDLYAKAASLN